MFGLVHPQYKSQYFTETVNVSCLNIYWHILNYAMSVSLNGGN